MNELKDNDIDVIAIGKISDICDGEGVNKISSYQIEYGRHG